jgi:hypothetical protein
MGAHPLGTENDARSDQRAWLDAEKERKRQLLLRRLRADPELTYAQIKERLGIGATLAKQWAEAAGLRIGPAAEHLGIQRDGELLKSIQKHRRGT